ncbi:MAG: YraN family protein [Pirellulales bacterium]
MRFWLLSFARRFTSSWRRALTAARTTLPWLPWPEERPSSLGERGERAAEEFLRRLGYVILERRVRGTLGEIDLIAVDGRTLVFVEVKTRRSHEKGRPDEAVDARKQRKLTILALAWLKSRRLLNHAARFDVVAVTWPDDALPPQIEHYRHAFDAVGRWQMFC